MKKWSIILMLLFLFVPTQAYAANDACPSPYTEKMDDKIEEFYEKDANLIQAYIMEIGTAIINMFELNTISQLVYGNPYCVWFTDGGEAGLEFGLFPSGIHDSIVEPGFSLFTSVFFLGLTLAILILGLRMSYSYMGIRPVHWQNEFYMYFVAVFCMIAYTWGVEWLFVINNAVVMSIKDVLDANGVNVSFAYISTSFIENAKTLNFSDILFFYAEWIILFFLNLVYLLRLFVVTTMMILGGAAIVSLLFEFTRPVFKFWLIGFISTIFLQSIHALYFAVVLLFISMESLSFIFKFFLLLLFLPMTTMLMSWFGMADGLLAVKGAQDASSKAAKAYLITKRFSKRNKGGTSTSNKPVDTVSGSKISELAKGGASWEKAGRAISTTNTILATAAGMTVGGGGAVLAGGLASKVTPAALQAPRNLYAGAKGLKATLADAKKDGFDLTNIQDKRQHYGKIGESVGTMFGKGEMGRGIGYAFSGVSRQRLLNSDELGGLNGVTPESIVAQNPGAHIQFQQTNEGSGFYLKDGDTSRLVSPIGAADPKLKEGQTRAIDYQARTLLSPNNLSSSIESQPLLSATSQPYIMDANQQKFNDPQFNANQVNFNDYYQANHANGRAQLPSDKVADWTSGRSQNRGEQ